MRTWPSRCKASVVVLTCGAVRTTLACLESIALTRYQDIQLIVVNNGGGQAMSDALQEFSIGAGRRLGDVQILGNETNRGACTGRNQALSRVEGEFAAFIDNDVVCRDPDWLARLIDVLQSDRSVGIVGPRIVSHAEPSTVESAGFAVAPRGTVLVLGAGSPLKRIPWRQRREVQCVGNFVARTETIRGVGGFDPDFDPFGFENVDVCYRCKAIGLRILCDGRTDLTHVGHVTTGRFADRGRRILFEKSLLLRKRWSDVFRQEQPFYEELAALGGGIETQEVPI